LPLLSVVGELVTTAVQSDLKGQIVYFLVPEQQSVVGTAETTTITLVATVVLAAAAALKLSSA